MTIAPGHRQPSNAGAKAFLAERDKRLLIDGNWRAGGAGSFATVDPATGAGLARIARGDAADVDLAVGAARRALETGPWKTMTPMDRARMLWAIADRMEAHIDELAEPPR
jgi:phenylacetaldehyde dehydrogenase